MDRSSGDVQSTRNRRDSKRPMHKDESPSYSSSKTTIKKETKRDNIDNQTHKVDQFQTRDGDNKTSRVYKDIKSPSSSNIIDRFIFEWNLIPTTTLVLFRVLFWSLYAMDCWNEIQRTSNYWRGLSDFNVPHLSPLLVPNIIYQWFCQVDDRVFLTLAFISIILSIRCALGLSSILGGRMDYIVLSICKFIMVFSSQTDNYQHHYLLVLILIILSTCNPSTFQYSTSSNNQQQNQFKYVWQIRLILIQLSIVYFWTFIAKLNWNWINGVVLPRMVGPEFQDQLKNVLLTISGSATLAEDSMKILSVMTMVSEVFLCIALHVPSLYPLVSIVGISMHIFMGGSGLRIGTFSYFMVLFYIFTLPRSIITFFERYLVKPVTNVINKLTYRKVNATPTPSLAIVMILGLIFCMIMAIQIVFPGQTMLFKQSIYVAIAFILLFNLLSMAINYRNIEVNQIIKDTLLILVSVLVICYLSISTPHFRKVYQDNASIAFGASKIDMAIDNYLMADQMAQREVVSNWLRIYSINDMDQEFEFIGDVGLFLETKNRWEEAYQLYRRYTVLAPNQLKIHTGMLRYLNQNNKVKEICELLPRVTSLANLQIQQLQTCKSVDCGRSLKHAGYVLNVCNQLHKKC